MLQPTAGATTARVNEVDIVIDGGPVRTARVLEEWYHELAEPEAMVQALKSRDIGADIFTFVQMPPDCTPRYQYLLQMENIAAIPLSSYQHWWDRQISNKTRSLVRKAEKSGVSVREVPFDDALVAGIKEIYDEVPYVKASHSGTTTSISTTFAESMQRSWSGQISSAPSSTVAWLDSSSWSSRESWPTPCTSSRRWNTATNLCRTR